MLKGFMVQTVGSGVFFRVGAAVDVGVGSGVAAAGTSCPGPLVGVGPGACVAATLTLVAVIVAWTGSSALRQDGSQDYCQDEERLTHVVCL